MSTVPKPIALPVTAVTCLEDRAHIERDVVLDLEAGVQRLRLGPVSALAVDRTLHAELTADHSATVLDARIVRSWTPRGPQSSSDEDSALRHRVHTLEEEQLALGQRRDRLQARLDLLGRLAADLLREIGEGAGSGRPNGPAGPPNWTGWTTSATPMASNSARWKPGWLHSLSNSAKRSGPCISPRRSPPSWSAISS